jgi:hypothetical protein
LDADVGNADTKEMLETIDNKGNKDTDSGIWIRKALAQGTQMFSQEYLRGKELGKRQ